MGGSGRRVDPMNRVVMTRYGASVAALLLLASLGATLDPTNAQASPQPPPQQQLPDLRIATVSVVEGAQQHEFVVTIQNAGDALSSPTQIEIAKRNTSPPASAFVQPIDPGKNLTVRVQWPSWIYGSAAFTATVDPLDHITERNETNNVLNRSVHLGTPELRVVSIVPLGTEHVAHEPVRLRATFENIGNGTAYDMGYNVTTSDGFTYGETLWGRLLPSGSTTGTFTWKLPNVGTHSVTVKADSPQMVPEGNESDNTRTVNVQATTPDPLTVHWANLAVDQSNVTGGKQYNLSLWTPLWGDHAPWTARAEFYDNGALIATEHLAWTFWGHPYSRVSDDQYDTTIQVARTHTIMDGHTPSFSARLVVEPDAAWAVTVDTNGNTIPPPSPGATPQPQPGPVLVSDPSWSANRTELGPEGLVPMDAAVVVGDTVVLRLPIHNPHNHTVRVDVFWQSGLGGDGDATYDVRVTPRSTVVVEHALPMQQPGAQIVTARVAANAYHPDHTPGALHFIAHTTVNVLPSGTLRIDASRIETNIDEMGWTVYRIPVQATGGPFESVRLEVVDDGGHHITNFDAPKLVVNTDARTFELRAFPDRDRPQSTIVVKAVGTAVESEPAELGTAAATDEPPAAPFYQRYWGVAAAVGVGGVGLLGGVFAFGNEWRRWSFLRRILQAGGAVGLFSRIQGPKVLEHGTREEIHRLVGERPGVHYREIQRALKLSNGRLAHHLNTLERERLVRSERDGALVRFFPAGARTTTGTALTPRQALILAEVKRRPGLLQSQLAEALGVSRQAVAQQVASLRTNGLLIATGAGRSNALYLENDVDRRLTRCNGCGTVYDRGLGVLQQVVCPACGSA